MPLLLLGLVFRRIESVPMPFFVKPIARKSAAALKAALSIRKPRCILPTSTASWKTANG